MGYLFENGLLNYLCMKSGGLRACDIKYQQLIKTITFCSYINADNYVHYHPFIFGI